MAKVLLISISGEKEVLKNLNCLTTPLKLCLVGTGLHGISVPLYLECSHQANGWSSKLDPKSEQNDNKHEYLLYFSRFQYIAHLGSNFQLNIHNGLNPELAGWHSSTCQLVVGRNIFPATAWSSMCSWYSSIIRSSSRCCVVHPRVSSCGTLEWTKKRNPYNFLIFCLLKFIP